MDTLTQRFNSDVLNPYIELLKSSYRFHSTFDHAKMQWESQLAPTELLNGPYLERAQAYKQGCDVEDLVLSEPARQTVKRKLGRRRLYEHQTEALKLILANRSTVIATGTSSGKTLCYQIPILDDILKDPSPGLRAIIIYPLNALVNDQLKEWGELLKEHPHITFAKFTGQTPDNENAYQQRIRTAIREQHAAEGISNRDLERLVTEAVNDAPQNRLNHREAIRRNPPHILITNFSMLEYLLERPIDSPIFDNARLKYLVMDEVHSYRGIQATEIAFLIRRLKQFLKVDRLVSIATSATLGDQNDPESTERVRAFATSLFGEDFGLPNPIYGTRMEYSLVQPSHTPNEEQYVRAADAISSGYAPADWSNVFDVPTGSTLLQALESDTNLHKLRAEILTRPTLLSTASNALWPTSESSENSLQALLQLAAHAKSADHTDDLLPTRLHYFVKSQGGLHCCFNPSCPGRRNGKPAFFLSRKPHDQSVEGLCPACSAQRVVSRLVEIVTCRKCGYLFGALQDLGPRRRQDPDRGEEPPPPGFDSFSTELGWSADSFWSYFSVDADLPYPVDTSIDDADADATLIEVPVQAIWCASCGKLREHSSDPCVCSRPIARNIRIFHRQCDARDQSNLNNPEKHLLPACPNCGARNASGLEPLRRFQESDDETGLAMAIPLSHFNVSGNSVNPSSQGLLCFTDHRQRAAAFPSLIEEEVFGHVLSRKLLQLVRRESKPPSLETLGRLVAEDADPTSDYRDSELFLPVSRLPDEQLTAVRMRQLWTAETFAYFGIPDSARESIEDFGLAQVMYSLDSNESDALCRILTKAGLSLEESTTTLQVLFSHVRHRKAFTLPHGISHEDPAFGRVTASVHFRARSEGIRNAEGWLPRVIANGSYKNNYITDYLQRVTSSSSQNVLDLAEALWNSLTAHKMLVPRNDEWRLDHQRLLVGPVTNRFRCEKCGIVTSFNVKDQCVRKACSGVLRLDHYDASRENIISRWVSDSLEYSFASLRSEEHTAQLNKELAERIENDFRSGELDILSSTTTFEMGINIGDLQKVLLRNAPPTSASYIQRVGRAGRGIDKNAISVTLCRQSKYDGDAWRQPERLMSGIVRTPTVFLQNAFIAQRHFNAVLFSSFLRQKLLIERLLGDVVQQIRLEAFLPSSARLRLPQSWRRVDSEIHLDFTTWLQVSNEEIQKLTEGPIADIVLALGGLEVATTHAGTLFREILAGIQAELEELFSERGRLFDSGAPAEDFDRAIKSLLASGVIDVLARKGFLPRYAFPLDTVTLETGRTRWTRDPDVDLSRDRGIAIAEFAPGAQVIANKKVFTSAGLYVVSKLDQPLTKFYSTCPGCRQIRTGSTKSVLMGACSVCGTRIPNHSISPYVEPLAFSTRIEARGNSSSRFRRSTFIRQRQTLTHFISQVSEDLFATEGAFDIALEPNGSLFRYNRGPAGKGFMQCKACGFSEPATLSRARRSHRRLRAFGNNSDCSGHMITQPIAYGHIFSSYCLIIRPTTTPTSVESVAYALQVAIALTLQIDPSDIGVSWRFLASRQAGIPRCEMVFFDQVAGGAGFMIDARRSWSRIVERSVTLVNSCTCDSSCYDCLKHYGNQSHHEKLRRDSVLEYLGPIVGSF